MFQFHHPAPELKTISVGCVAVTCDLPGFSTDFLTQELKHCVLTCIPCHDAISAVQTHKRPPGNNAAFPVDPAAIAQINAMIAEIDAWMRADREYTNFKRLKYATGPRRGPRPKTRSQRPTPLPPNLWALLTCVRYPNGDAVDPYSGPPPPPSPAVVRTVRVSVPVTPTQAPDPTPYTPRRRHPLPDDISSATASPPAPAPKLRSAAAARPSDCATFPQ
jgi:hypothetical protein